MWCQVTQTLRIKRMTWFHFFFQNGFTPLHVACKKNREQVIQLLLKFGANVHSANEVSQQFAFPCNSVFENNNNYCASFAMVKPKK